MIQEKDIIRFEGVNCESTRGSLHGISFSVPLGSNVCFFGPEESGIELLFDLILGLRTEYRGSIRYLGNPIDDLDYIDMLNHKKSIGYLHGDYGLLSNMSVQENIALPLEYHSRLTKAEILKRVHLLIDELNLDHCRKLRPVSLNNSEVLRTAYARALAMDPYLFLVEHAFENQSPVNIHAFLRHLGDRCNEPERSTFFVTFEPEKILEFADTFIMLFSGRIVFRGSREELISGKNPYVAQYLEGSETGPMIIL
jgi:phospholipid/cholesterol/gamma-HCH transport system ATP-binding protein